MSVVVLVLLKVKCPYSCKDKSILEATAESTVFLAHNDGITNLKTNHAYFYQIQAQMRFCSASYCDLVVWRGVICAENIPK